MEGGGLPKKGKVKTQLWLFPPAVLLGSTLSWELPLVGSVLGQGWESERGVETGRQ